MTPEELVAEARHAAVNAYAPYSHWRVGSVVVDADGNRYAGANVENGAYGSAMCAEATAIGHAVSAGARKLDTIAVASLDATEPGYPCGNCLQLMIEFDIRTVIVEGPDGPLVYDFEELLPHGFRLDPDR